MRPLVAALGSALLTLSTTYVSHAQTPIRTVDSTCIFLKYDLYQDLRQLDRDRSDDDGPHKVTYVIPLGDDYGKYHQCIDWLSHAMLGARFSERETESGWEAVITKKWSEQTKPPMHQWHYAMIRQAIAHEDYSTAQIYVNIVVNATLDDRTHEENRNVSIDVFRKVDELFSTATAQDYFRAVAWSNLGYMLARKSDMDPLSLEFICTQILRASRASVNRMNSKNASLVDKKGVELAFFIPPT